MFVGGLVFRVIRVVGLGWSRDRAPSAGSKVGGVAKSYAKGLIVWPFIPWVKQTFSGNAVTLIAGGIFHLGLFAIIFLGTPHMLGWKSLLGFGWPTLPLPIIDWLAAAAIAALVALAINRMSNPLLRKISGPGEVLNWIVVFLPMVTGYMTTHHLMFRYEVIYSLHVICGERAVDLDPLQPNLALRLLLLLEDDPRSAVRQAGGDAVMGGAMETKIALDTFVEETGGWIASQLEACTRCGICAEACHFYQATGNPEFSPVWKVDLLKRAYEQEFTLGGKLRTMLGLQKKIDKDDLEAWSKLVYQACTVCNKCAMVCPDGDPIGSADPRCAGRIGQCGHGPAGPGRCGPEADGRGKPPRCHRRSVRDPDGLDR